MRDFFIEKLVKPVAQSPAIDGVFYDCFNFAYVVRHLDTICHRTDKLPCPLRRTMT